MSEKKLGGQKQIWSNAEVGFGAGSRGHKQRKAGSHSKVEKARKKILT